MNDNEFNNLLDHYRSVFNNKSGERVIKDLLIFIKGTAIDRLSPNPNAAVYRIGQQSILERIEKMRKMDKDET